METHDNIKGFFSYARQNDKNSGGSLSLLRKSIEAELWEQTGENIEIFQDQEDISWGELWEKKIIASLNSSKFLIAIVTPGYLKSRACRFELEHFLNLEKTIGSERILPLIYIETPELKRTKDPVFSEINNRQWHDWSDRRFSSLTSSSTKKRIEKISREIRDLIAEEIFPTSTNETNFNIPNSIVSATIPKNEELPPPPINFPDGWDTEWQPSFDEVVIAAKPAPEFKKSEEQDEIIPSLYVPMPKSEIDEEQPRRQITLILPTTGDSERDRRRIKTLYGTMISFHGRDQFSFQIFENQKGHLIDFPNDTTRISPELLFRLNKLMGGKYWKIELIIFK